jgi:hypothetical protein
MTWKPGRNEAKQLRSAGYDGLYNTAGECACKADDLYPCGERGPDCAPGVLKPCDGQLSACPCEWHIGPRDEEAAE